MEIIIIVLILAFLLVEILNNKRIWELQKRLNENEKVRLTREQKKKIEAMRTSFDNLMNYDEEIAMKRK